ncbi:MAG: hypothetical protein CVU41_13820 [Chloroflexi bacterium HGW-Chloroflexi-3]|nr:MAG: hypothetical protein CVU41_13820 [Chloroflexi bacterium HGW-Chloroflexi-3]
MKVKLLSIVLLVLFLTACQSNPLFNTDAEKVLDVTAQIVDFPLPIGFKPELTANYKGYNFVSYKPGAKDSHLYFVQSTNSTDEENLQNILDVLVPGASDKESRQEVLENLPITFHGQETTMIHTKGINSDGKTYQQILVGFEGKSGPALVVYSSLSADWDMEEVFTLLESVQ